MIVPTRLTPTTRALTLVAAVALATSAGGCATLFKTKSTPVVMNGSQGAEVIVDGQSKGRAPLTVELDNKVAHTVIIRDASGDKTCNISASASTGWVVLGILAGGVGWIIDWATGAWNDLSTTSCG